MTDAEIIIWNAKYTDSNFTETAVGTVMNDMDPLLNFTVNAYDYSTSYRYDTSGDSTWNEVLNGFNDHVKAYYGTPNDNEYHMILVDRTYDSLGAGITKGGAIGLGNGNIWSGSDAIIGGVNVAVKAYANSSGCMTSSSSGTDVFRNTVIHETGHGLLDPDFCTYPSDGCDNGSSDEHSLGAITGSTYHDVTPMMTWYTALSCDDNPAVCNNCSGDETESPGGVTTALSNCSIDQMEQFWTLTN